MQKLRCRRNLGAILAGQGGDADSRKGLMSMEYKDFALLVADVDMAFSTWDRVSTAFVQSTKSNARGADGQTIFALCRLDYAGDCTNLARSANFETETSA